MDGVQYDSRIKDVRAPMMVSFDITSNCNLKCAHCFNDSGLNAPNKDVSPTQKLEIAAQIAKLRPFNVCLCGGETLCCDNILEIMDALSPYVGNLSMVTNGYALTLEKAKELKAHGLTLGQVSVDGAYAWQHDSFRGVNGSFERATNALRYFKEAGVKQRAVSLVPNKLNCRSMDDYLRLCRSLGVQNVRMMPFLPSGRGHSVGRNLMPDANDMFAFGRDIVRLQREYAGKLRIEWGDPLDHMRRMPANARVGLKTYCMEVKVNGDLTVSTYLPVVAGNCLTHSLEAYWRAGYDKIWGDIRFTQYTDQIKDIYDLEDFSPAPYSGEKIVLDIMEGAK